MGRAAGAALALAATVVGCGHPAPAEPPPPVEGADLVAVWTVTGDTTNRARHDTTYFTDPGSPRLASGEASVIWQCTGSGQLEVALVVAQRASGAPDLSGAVVRVVVPCPTDGVSGDAQIRDFPRRLIGAENAIVVRPAVEPSGPITYTVVVAQRT